VLSKPQGIMNCGPHSSRSSFAFAVKLGKPLAITLLTLSSVAMTAPAIADCCDFNADGNADVIWRHALTGENGVWYMNGTNVGGGSNFPTVSDPDWKLAGAADFNGDERPDVLWRNTLTGQNAIWFMNGSSVLGYSFISTLANTDWQIVGTGDFNADANSDIVWRNNLTGQNALWYLNGAAVIGNTYFTPLADTSWQIMGIGDFNADGKPDIVWRNGESGQNALWYMNGPDVMGVAFMASLSSVEDEWALGGIGDFNQDSKPDLLWRNYETGQNAFWYLDGAAVTSYAFIPSVVDTFWIIVPSDRGYRVNIGGPM
jgi:hypothetical protein